MSNQKFENFINQVNQKKDVPTTDWDKNRDEWLSYLSGFYKTIEGFLEEYKQAGKLNYDYSKKEIFEEYIGSYTVDVMNIRLGEHKVKLEPIGTNLIGAHGRVDLIGANGKVKIGLVNKNYSDTFLIKVSILGEDKEESKTQEIKKAEKIELEWKIATPPPRIKYIELNQEFFFDAMLEVVGG